MKKNSLCAPFLLAATLMTGCAAFPPGTYQYNQQAGTGIYPRNALNLPGNATFTGSQPTRILPDGTIIAEEGRGTIRYSDRRTRNQLRTPLQIIQDNMRDINTSVNTTTRTVNNLYRLEDTLRR